VDDFNFFDEYQKYSEEMINEVGKPVVDFFSMSVNSGMYYTAKTHGLLGFDVGVRTMTVIIPDGESAIMDSVNINYFSMPVIQATLGLPMNIDVTVRGLGIPFQDKTVSLYGGGIKKNFNSLIPVPQFPSIAVGAAFHQFKAGDIITSSHLSFTGLASKTFLIITPYVGYSYDINSMKFDYTYIYEESGFEVQVPISEKIKSNSSRVTLGLTVSPIPFVKVFGEYNIGKFSEFSAGLAISIR